MEPMGTKEPQVAPGAFKKEQGLRVCSFRVEVSLKAPKT